MWFRASGRGLIAAKGGSQQRKYLCDEQNQGCKARVQWVKQATDEWKVSRLDGEHAALYRWILVSLLSRYSSPFINLSPFFLRNFGPERKHACSF